MFRFITGGFRRCPKWTMNICIVGWHDQWTARYEAAIQCRVDSSDDSSVSPDWLASDIPILKLCSSSCNSSYRQTIKDDIFMWFLTICLPASGDTCVVCVYILFAIALAEHTVFECSNHRMCTCAFWWHLSMCYQLHVLPPIRRFSAHIQYNFYSSPLLSLLHSLSIFRTSSRMFLDKKNGYFNNFGPCFRWSHSTSSNIRL